MTIEDDEVRRHQSAYVLRLADDALILAQRLSEWCSHAPEIEQDIALANIALDLLGQARSLLTHAGDLEGIGRSEDDLAYARDERAFTNALLVEHSNADFAVTIARQLLFSAYQLELYRHLGGCQDEQLAAIAAKAVKEVSYHREHALEWTLRLGDGTALSHERMQAALERLWPYTRELFEGDELTEHVAAEGLAVRPEDLEEGWRAFVTQALAEATLSVPKETWWPRGGREGLHTEAFGYLVAELQHLHRSLPGVEW
jgi:ring-1,2-phenylacetyl-CoA epoxidase subunit PaaC